MLVKVIKDMKDKQKFVLKIIQRLNSNTIIQKYYQDVGFTKTVHVKTQKTF
jgi:hypothetical protein